MGGEVRSTQNLYRAKPHIADSPKPLSTSKCQHYGTMEGRQSSSDGPHVGSRALRDPTRCPQNVVVADFGVIAAPRILEDTSMQAYRLGGAGLLRKHGSDCRSLDGLCMADFCKHRFHPKAQGPQLTCPVALWSPAPISKTNQLTIS